MYESYYGFVEKPFSLTPDPKFLYRSPSHSGAFELLQYAIRRREGFVVITGDIGTGKTTLCRALLEEIDRTTYTALALSGTSPSRKSYSASMSCCLLTPVSAPPFTSSRETTPKS